MKQYKLNSDAVLTQNKGAANMKMSKGATAGGVSGKAPKKSGLFTPVLKPGKTR